MPNDRDSGSGLAFSVVFVCQRGDLEIKSLLLAFSLRRYWGERIELVAAVPQPASLWGELSATARSLLARLGIRCVPISNPIGPDYPIGNKLACLSIPTAARMRIFLDSDILCLGAADFSVFPTACLSAKPADFATFGADEAQWQAAYACCDATPPPERIRATVSGELMWPYFNAGVIAVDATTDFGGVWIDCAHKIDVAPAVCDKRPWLDQIALPVAARRVGLVVNCLPEAMNYPAHAKSLDPAALPVLCHYHAPATIRREPLLNALVCDLVAPHPALHRLMESHAEWAALLKPYALPPTAPWWRRRFLPLPTQAAACRTAAKAPDLLITGLPRSGTSYLCGLLHRVADTVIINEPVEVFEALGTSALPWGIALLHGTLRQAIRDGRPVANKLKDGEFIEDTAQVDIREAYLPRIGCPDFLLGTKNTLAYLARLPQLRQVMPRATVVACIRDPFATIASWKTTFSHLASADLAAQAVGHADDLQLTIQQRARLAEIAATAHLPIRRALLWRHLAGILLEQEAPPLILRYEEIVTQPVETVRRILAAIPGAPPLRTLTSLQPSPIRARLEALDAEDVAAILEVCTPCAEKFGYELKAL